MPSAESPPCGPMVDSQLYYTCQSMWHSSCSVGGGGGGSNASMQSEHRILRGLLGGATWTAHRATGHAILQSDRCPLCRGAPEMEVHILWDCPCWESARQGWMPWVLPRVDALGAAKGGCPGCCQGWMPWVLPRVDALGAANGGCPGCCQGWMPWVLPRVDALGAAKGGCPGCCQGWMPWVLPRVDALGAAKGGCPGCWRKQGRFRRWCCRRHGRSTYAPQACWPLALEGTDEGAQAERMMYSPCGMCVAVLSACTAAEEAARVNGDPASTMFSPVRRRAQIHAVDGHEQHTDGPLCRAPMREPLTLPQGPLAREMGLGAPVDSSVRPRHLRGAGHGFRVAQQPGTASRLGHHHARQVLALHEGARVLLEAINPLQPLLPNGTLLEGKSPRREVVRSSAGAGVVYLPFWGSFA